MQPTMFDIEPAFDGETFDPDRDQARLAGSLLRVFTIMQDGRWRSLGQLQHCAGGSEAGISARLRDLRKQKFGGYCVDRRRRDGGLWEYRLNLGRD